MKKTQDRPKSSKTTHREPGDLYWIGTNIFRLRSARRLTQIALAKKAGVTARALRGIENAETDANPTLKTLGGIAGALGVETIDLYRRRKGDLAVNI